MYIKVKWNIHLSLCFYISTKYHHSWFHYLFNLTSSSWKCFLFKFLSKYRCLGELSLLYEPHLDQFSIDKNQMNVNSKNLEITFLLLAYNNTSKRKISFVSIISMMILEKKSTILIDVIITSFLNNIEIFHTKRIYQSSLLILREE